VSQRKTDVVAALQIHFLVRPLGLSSLLCPYGDILPSPLSLFFLFLLILFNYLTPSALIFISFVFSFVNDGGEGGFNTVSNAEAEGTTEAQ
jgi:hypothetical protein